MARGSVALPKPYPIQPLLDAARITSIKALGPLWSRDLRRLIAAGRNLNFHQADKWAVRLGYHPAEIWDSWGEPDDLEEVAS